jgi:hypothetical protein
MAGWLPISIRSEVVAQAKEVGAAPIYLAVQEALCRVDI